MRADLPAPWCPRPELRHAFRVRRAGAPAAFGGSASDSHALADEHPVIQVLPTGYVPSSITVSAGKPVTIKLDVPGKLSCTSIFRIPKLNVLRQLSPNSTSDLTVTFPKPGSYTYTCGMGMFTGTIQAI